MWSYKYLILHIFRKSDGRRYSEGVSSVRDSDFAFPAPRSTPVQLPAKETIERGSSYYSDEIATLQARLHEALAQLDQSNSQCVFLVNENDGLKRKMAVVQDESKKSTAEILVLRRKLSALDLPLSYALKPKSLDLEELAIQPETL